MRGIFKENPIKRKIKNRELVLGSTCQTLHPAMVELMGLAGMDFVVLNMEDPSAVTIDDVIHCVRAAETVGVTAFIKVFYNDKFLIQQALATGASGVMVPHVDSKEEAEAAVKAAKYPPEGVRATCTLPRSASWGLYSNEEFEEYWQLANRETMVTIMPLESKRALENMKETITAPGIDLCSLSASDIARALDVPRDSPKIREKQNEFLEACKKIGVSVYALGGGDPKTMQYWYDRGVRVFYCGNELNIRNYYEEIVQRVKNLGWK